eukprot:g58965.t1
MGCPSGNACGRMRVSLTGRVGLLERVSVLMSQCPSVLVRAQVSVILPRPIHCTPYVAQGKGTPRAYRRSKRWVSFSIHVASVELVELELLELASSSSSSDLTDRVVPLVPFLELSLDGRSDVAALAVPGVGRVGAFLIDE